MSKRIGQQLGNYRLIRLLGRGGFAEVYLAEHIYLKTQVAVKILHIQIIDDAVQHFTREAQIIATLKSPHIIQVLDFGIEGSIPFLVMDFAPHGSLRQVCPQGTSLPLAMCIDYVKQVASALQYAHERKIIHRDVKPENILVGSYGEVLLTDFGIAVISQSSRFQGNQEVGGTVAYMAPEQLQGKATTASDQYALAIVLYEWLSGTLPFTGSFTEICSQHVLVQPPSLVEKLPSLPPGVETVIFKALAKDPEQRYPKISAFAEALEQEYQEHMSSLPAVTVQGNQPESTTYQLPIPGSAQTAWAPLQILPTIPATPTPSFPSAPTRKGNSRKYTTVIALLVLIIILMGASGIYFFNTQKTTSKTPVGVLATQRSIPGTLTSAVVQTPQPPTPTPTPLAPPAGKVLYQENGSDNWGGWTGTSDWKTLNGQLLNDGTHDITDAPPTITAPYQVEKTANYAVEAKISVQRQNQGTNGNAFAITVRGATNKGVWQGYPILIATSKSGSTAYIQDNNNTFSGANLAQAPFDPGTAVHTYRVEVKDNDIRVLIDGYLKVETKDNKFLTGGQVGLVSYNDQITVSNFTVITL